MTHGGQAEAVVPSVEAAPPPAPPPSLSEHVSQVLRAEILAGRLPPGSRLTEAAVMQRTAVGRTPVREGLRRLEAEGLVTTYRGRGTYVSYRLSSEEALLIYDCRLILEPHLTALATERMEADAVAALGAITERFSQLGNDAGQEAVELDTAFHLAIYNASGSELTTVIRGYWSRMQLELSQRVYAAERPRRFASEHRDIYEAIRRRDPRSAGDLMRRHIEHGRQSIARALESDRVDISV